MNKCRYLQSSHLGKLDIHLKAVTNGLRSLWSSPGEHYHPNLSQANSQPFQSPHKRWIHPESFWCFKTAKPIQNHLITKLAIPLKNDIQFTSGNRGFHIRGWLNRGCEPRARMQKADCVPSIPLFFVRDLSVHGFSYPFWYPRGFL